MPEHQVFLTDSRMDELFGYVKWLLFYVSPFVMIGIAILTVGMMIAIIVGIFHVARSRKSENDDETEVYRY